MNKFSGFALLLVSVLAVHRPAEGDEAAIRETLRAYVEAFNKQDLPTVAAMWAENATHTDRETGERTESREAIQADIAAAFKDQPDARLSGRVDRVKQITTDVASVEGQTSVVGPDGGQVESAFSAILVNRDGKWLLESVGQQVATADEFAQSAMDLATVPPPASEEQVAEVEWLPLGTFAVSAGEKDVEPTRVIQLAVSKEGIISGTLYNSKTDQADSVQGQVDKETQRVAFRVGESEDVVVETGLTT